MSKLYKVGFYGGKFMPFHTGHLFCTRRASEECEKVYLVLFFGGDQENEIISNSDNTEKYNRMYRWCDTCKAAYKYFDNVEPVFIDVSDCKLQDGSEDWDAETPLVLNAIGKMDAVYSSEPGYDEYFKRAYPWAKHILVDPPRINYPISGTMLRSMTDEKEKIKWRI